MNEYLGTNYLIPKTEEEAIGFLETRDITDSMVKFLKDYELPSILDQIKLDGELLRQMREEPDKDKARLIDIQVEIIGEKVKQYNTYKDRFKELQKYLNPKSKLIE